MWQVLNSTLFRADGGFGQDPDGAKRWIVAIKATYLCVPGGSCELALEQEDIHRAPVPQGERGQSPPLYEIDLAPTKARTDVLLQGTAYAPVGKPATSVDVTLQVAAVRKTIRVLGDRRWERGPLGLRASAPAPFEQLPLSYARAYGGCVRDAAGEIVEVETRNPVGVGLAVTAEQARGAPLPNLEDPHNLIRSWRDRPRPMAFGPLDASWEPRRSLAGTYDERWLAERRPFLPEDFDPEHHQQAPPDQQAEGFLRGGEQVELQNLSPEGYLTFTLPRVVPGLLSLTDEGFIPHHTRLHTVLIEPDRKRVMLTWQGSLRLGRDPTVLRWTRVFEKQRLPRASGLAEPPAEAP